MNEIEKRIATTWPGRPTTADVDATRLADLRAVKAEIERLAGVVEVQADITGQLGASFHALAARVAALEDRAAKCPAAPMPFEADTMQHEDPAPPAPLVERMLAAWTYARGNAGDGMRAALLVAAEELLDEITQDEWDDACARYGVNGQGAITNAVLRARLARAKEAARG